jgi:hypothetical protein
MTQDYISMSTQRFRKFCQPTAAELAGLGIKVKDFAYESTLQPVRTVYRQPKQIQPHFQQLHREDTEPLIEISQNQFKSESDSQDRGRVLCRTDTEAILEETIGSLVTREFGGFLERNGAMDCITQY